MAPRPQAPAGDAEQHPLAKPMDFILAGNAYFTIRSRRTGTRFTYRVSLPRDKEEPQGPDKRYFVSLLTGPDNWSNYTYIGLISVRPGQPGGPEFRLTKGSKLSMDAPGVKAFAWAWARIATGQPIPAGLEVWHEGKCGRCGRKLTVPESIASGIGPECALKV